MDDTTNTNNNTNNTNKEKFKINLQGLRTKFNEKYRTRIFNKKFLTWFGIIVAILIVVVGIKTMFSNSSSSSNSQSVQISTLKKTNINRNFDFPIKDDKGKEVGKLSYNILSAELDSQILVQGKLASAVQGKKFLVINIKLSNNQDKGIQINTKDYLRLSVNGNAKELLAPSLHNDPVAVQPISIQYSRLGFIVSDSDKDPVLQVGEIKGEKTDIKINF